MNRAGAYTLFFVFCTLVSARDVLSERFFRHAAVDPALALLVYSLVTQAIVLIKVGPRGLFDLGEVSAPKERRRMWGGLTLLNLSTGLSFITYFLAFKTPLGSGLSSVLGFGSDPIITALLGAWLLGETLDRKFWVATSICTLSIVVLFWGTFQTGQVSVAWITGLLLCLASTFFFALAVIAMKDLMNRGAPKLTLVFHRLTFTLLGSAIYLAIKPELWNPAAIPSLLLVGITGFAMPLIIFPYVIQRMTVANLAVLLFLIPACTLLFSWLLGMRHYTSTELAGASLLFLAVWAYHWKPAAPATAPIA